jgi:hypothetical protein
MEAEWRFEIWKHGIVPHVVRKKTSIQTHGYRRDQIISGVYAWM